MTYKSTRGCVRGLGRPDLSDLGDLGVRLWIAALGIWEGPLLSPPPPSPPKKKKKKKNTLSQQQARTNHQHTMTTETSATTAQVRTTNNFHCWAGIVRSSPLFWAVSKNLADPSCSAAPECAKLKLVGYLGEFEWGLPWEPYPFLGALIGL